MKNSKPKKPNKFTQIYQTNKKGIIPVSTSIVILISAFIFSMCIGLPIYFCQQNTISRDESANLIAGLVGGIGGGSLTLGGVGGTIHNESKKQQKIEQEKKTNELIKRLNYCKEYFLKNFHNEFIPSVKHPEGKKLNYSEWNKLTNEEKNNGVTTMTLTLSKLTRNFSTYVQYLSDLKIILGNDENNYPFVCSVSNKHRGSTAREILKELFLLANIFNSSNGNFNYSQEHSKTLFIYNFLNMNTKLLLINYINSKYIMNGCPICFLELMENGSNFIYEKDIKPEKPK